MSRPAANAPAVAPIPGASLPHLIAYVPSGLDRSLVKEYSGKKHDHYDEVDDRQATSEAGGKVGMYYFGWGFLGLTGFAGVVAGLQTFLLVTFIPSLACFLLGYLTPVKHYVLDRERGLVTYPDWFLWPSHTVPVEELRVTWQGTGGASGALGQDLVTAPPGGGFPRAIDMTMHPGDFAKSWSFILWYMDRNRPLPPGDAFDEYRERDFARRRAEGFPPPMFRSTFPTPEATPAQDAERRRYWRDEDYFGRSTSAWY